VTLQDQTTRRLTLIQLEDSHRTALARNLHKREGNAVEQWRTLQKR